MKRIGIEAMLEWAYRRELPKVAAERRAAAAPRVLAGGSAWWRVSEACELGALVDANVYGCVPVDGDEGEPHDDAVRLAALVEAVSDATVVGRPDDYAPIEDWGDPTPLLRAAVARAEARVWGIDPKTGETVLRETLADLVRRVAILGPSSIEWWGAPPYERVVCGPSGQEAWFRKVRAATKWDIHGDAIAWADVEVDGMNRKPKFARPFPDAYRRSELVPDPVEILVARMRWQIWRAGLDALAEAADGCFAEHLVMPSSRPYGPWIGGGTSPRVLTVTGGGDQEWARASAVLRRDVEVGGERREKVGSAA